MLGYRIFLVTFIVAFFSFVETINAAQTVRDGIYDGPTADGKPEGKGLFIWSRGRYHFFQGEFSDGKIDGEGTLNFRDGTSCSGIFDNQLTGQGNVHCQYRDGSTYIGAMIYGKRNGIGVLIGKHPTQIYCVKNQAGLLQSKLKVRAIKNCK